MAADEPAAARREHAVVYLMAGVQFVNILDFMMVNPLGPRLADALAVPTSSLPVVAGSYTASASVTGILGSLYLERFDRRTALVVTLLGLAAGTALGGLAVDFATLILARVVAGAFGGPATSLAFAIVADAIPTSRRGWAMGVVAGGFAVASVLGVPAGLLLANAGGWRMPFFGVALLVLVAAAGALRVLPPLRAHLAALSPSQSSFESLLAVLRKRIVLASLAMTVLVMMSGFIIIPNLPAYLQYNLGFPGERLDVVYLLGGATSLVAGRVVGPLVDRFGSARVAFVGSAMIVLIVAGFFVSPVRWVPILVFTTAFFAAMSIRVVAYNTLTSRVPDAHERARFQSIQSAVAHAASAGAAFLSARLLSELPDKKLAHIDRVAIASIAMTTCVPFVMALVERVVRTRASVPPPA